MSASSQCSSGTRVSVGHRLPTISAASRRLGSRPRPWWARQRAAGARRLRVARRARDRSAAARRIRRARRRRRPSRPSTSREPAGAASGSARPRTSASDAPASRASEEHADRLEREALVLESQHGRQAVLVGLPVDPGATTQRRVGQQAEGLQGADAPGRRPVGCRQFVDGHLASASRHQVHLTSMP